jgi:hypothetical protein
MELDPARWAGTQSLSLMKAGKSIIRLRTSLAARLAGALLRTRRSPSPRK